MLPEKLPRQLGREYPRLVITSLEHPFLCEGPLSEPQVDSWSETDLSSVFGAIETD